MGPTGGRGMVTGVAGALALAAGLHLAAQTQGQTTPQTPVRSLGAQGQRGGQQGQGQRGGQAGQTNQPARDSTTQPQPAAGTGVISGAISVEGSGTPARRARVTLSGAGLRPSRTATTNDQGQFSFASLPAGRFTLSASKPGYVDMTYGAKKPGHPGTPIQLADGQKIEKLNVALPKGGVVTGVVIDESGEPSPGTQVRLMRYVLRTGEKTLQQTGSDLTDDRGIYRIYGQQPGEYIVSAVPRNNGLGDLRATLAAEVDSLIQQAQAQGALNTGPGGAGGGGRGGGAGGGGRAGQALQGMAMGGGRGQQLLDQAAALQQQIAQQDQERSVAYAPVYYPGTIAASAASTVTLGVGEERSGVDFQLQLVSTAMISGTVTSPTGSLPPGTMIQLVPAGQSGMPSVPGVGANMARANQEGKFAFIGITPGQYTIAARAAIRQQTTDPNTATTTTTAPAQPGRGADPNAFGPGRGGRGGPGQLAQILWASVDVTVNGQDVSDVALNLQPGMTVSGRVAFDGSTLAPPTDLTRVRVTIQARGQQTPELGNIPPAQVDASGHFTLTGVPPGRYVLQGNAPAGNGGGGGGARGGAGGQASGNWTLKSADVGGRDSLDFPFEVQPNGDVGGAVLTFTDRTQELSGTLVDSSGRPTSDYTIIVFPSDKSFWLPQSRRIQSARPSTDGTYSVRGLPPGDYRVIAVTDVETGEWYDPAFLSQLLGASMPITLTAGEKKTQDLRLAGGGQ
ncbi:MAG TPA: carboxypeptidase-like regulatory domain-containing protein [Vicinamibacterales bacterium]|nr:carboxypeptidase-like regulatory domain-containing protein [Vicinamibacterales bacterium]